MSSPMATAAATKPGATARSQVSQMTQFTWTATTSAASR